MNKKKTRRKDFLNVTPSKIKFIYIIVVSNLPVVGYFVYCAC